MHFLGLGIAILIGILVAQDANKRGMNGVLWGILCALVCIVFLPIYLIVRKPMLAEQGGVVQGPPVVPPPAGAQRFCNQCGTALASGARFCAKCGATQNG